MVDFQWHPTDAYTMMSVSEDEKGGTIQLWRICDMIYRPEKEVLAELERHRCAENLASETSRGPLIYEDSAMGM